MCAFEERHQMVLAHGIERDIVHDDHLVVMLVEERLEMDGRVLVQAAEAFLVHTSHAGRRFQKPFAVRVFPNAFQDQANALLDLVQVHFVVCHRCLPAI